MTQFWTILNAAGDVAQPCCATPDAETPPSAIGEPWEEGFEAVPVDAPPDLHRMIWTAEGWILSPQVARDAQWEAAKAYRAARQALPLPIPDIIDGEIIVADTDPESAAIVDRLARGAMTAIMMQAPFSLTFTDHNNAQFTVGATQTVQIGNAVLMYQSLCHGASQAVRKALDDALEAGATAEQILAIDITAGYPGEAQP